MCWGVYVSVRAHVCLCLGGVSCMLPGLKGSNCPTSLHYGDGEIPERACLWVQAWTVGSWPSGYRWPHHLEFSSCLNKMRSLPQCLGN